VTRVTDLITADIATVACNDVLEPVRVYKSKTSFCSQSSGNLEKLKQILSTEKYSWSFTKIKKNFRTKALWRL
jgi:hypothetical protein